MNFIRANSRDSRLSMLHFHFLRCLRLFAAKNIPMANSGIFIAGTGTEVGKTHVGAMIAGAIFRAGYRVGVYKPVASGCRKEVDGLFCEDASELWREAGRPGEFAKVCPQLFRAALSPPVAARKEGKQVDPALLRSGLEYWLLRSDVVVVEGAGGLMSPLSEHDYNIDLAAEFGFPLVIVAANRLGVVNDVLQTVTTARTRAPKLPIAGIILNQTTSECRWGCTRYCRRWDVL
jgi:dethiobiotin synthetase